MFTLQNVKAALVRKFEARVAAVPALVALGAVGSSAHAAGEFTFDPSPIVAIITGGVTIVSALGIAVLSLVVVVKLFKWVQRVL